MGIYKKRL